MNVRIDHPLDDATLVTVDRPERLNAMTHELIIELSDRLTEISRDDRCRVVVLTGAGRAFCAGLDLNGYGDDERAASQGVVSSMS